MSYFLFFLFQLLEFYYIKVFQNRILDFFNRLTVIEKFYVSINKIVHDIIFTCTNKFCHVKLNYN